MNILRKTINTLTRITKWMALASLTFMMLFIAVAVTARTLNFPIVGDVEIVQLTMVVLIMLGLGYSQSVDAHISIGLIVDRFSTRTQAVFDVLGYTLTFLTSLYVSWIFLGETFNNMFEFILTTNLLELPLYPFKFIIFIGFLFWGLEAFLKVITALVIVGKGSSTD